MLGSWCWEVSRKLTMILSMIDNTDFQTKNKFHVILSLMKIPDGLWNCKKRYIYIYIYIYIWDNASVFFWDSCKNDWKLLLRETDFKLVIKFCIHFILEDITCATECWVFDVLKSASRITGKENIRYKRLDKNIWYNWLGYHCWQVCKRIGKGLDGVHSFLNF